jgi:hypothetical protein
MAVVTACGYVLVAASVKGRVWGSCWGNGVGSQQEVVVVACC